MENSFNNDEFIKHLNRIKEEDPDKFMDMVLDILKKDESYAFEDGSPVEKKRTALSTMIKRYEELERYEDCAFLNSLKNRLA